ncbi:MAG: response regulator, partial [bacterium]
MDQNRIKILIIEDNPADTRLIKEMLKESRTVFYELESRDTLDSGLKYLASADSDMVLLDLSLPDSQGLESYNKLHSQFANMPVIV